jgi:glycosyltransferase involved in cell wall biosynthesis
LKADGKAGNSLAKRLAIFLPGLYGGGAERVILNLASGFAGKGHNVDLVVAQAEGPYLREVPAAVRVVALNHRRLQVRRTLASLPALVRYLRRERPDAMISGLHANIIALWARRITGIPERVIISEHSTFSHQNRLLPAWYGRVMCRLVCWFYPWADGIVAVSKGVANDLEQTARIPRDLIRVIYNPIVTPELRKKANDPLEHPWFKSGEPPVILGVGRLELAKDFATLIQAFARVRETFSARLLILGEGNERLALEALVRRLSLEQDVSLPGFVPNPYPFIAKASLFVLSSRWEGLPTVLVEALYCGTPVVSTDCPSGPREILRDGQYGKLVPVGNVAALAQSIEAILDDEGDRPPRESVQPFEIETVVQKYIRILLEG